MSDNSCLSDVIRWRTALRKASYYCKSGYALTSDTT